MTTTDAKPRIVEANGIRMHIAEQGTGAVVLLRHGFPECWYSWRHQLSALAAAGFHATAPNMRGYGQTDAPQEVDHYSLLHLLGHGPLARCARDRTGGDRLARLGRPGGMACGAVAPQPVPGGNRIERAVPGARDGAAERFGKRLERADLAFISSIAVPRGRRIDRRQRLRGAGPRDQPARSLWFGAPRNR